MSNPLPSFPESIGECELSASPACLRRDARKRASGRHKSKGMNHGLRRAGRCHQFLVPARGLACARDGRTGGGAGACRHRHCRPQYAGRRGARPQAAKEHSIRLLVGARLVTTDGFEAVCYPTDRAAYGRLCRLLTTGNRRAIKGQCHFTFEDMLAESEGQILIAVPPPRLTPDLPSACDTRSGRARPQSISPPPSPTAATSAGASASWPSLPRQTRTPLVATNDALYHHPDRKPLADVLTCIREKCTIAQAGYRLEANAERHLKPRAEMARLFARYPEAIARSLEIAERITLQPRGAALRIPRRAGAAGQDPASLPGGADLGSTPHGAIPTACPTRCARSSTRSWR